MTYDPQTARFLCFAAARAAFAAASDTPRAYLERCLERVAQLEPTILVFACFDLERARAVPRDRKLRSDALE